jgi:flagellar biosynthesis/type III secretory pathway protein FliH
LDEQQQRDYEWLLQAEPFQEIGLMMQTTYEKGLEKGREQGREQGQRRALQVQLERKFGPLSVEVQRRLEEWPAERLNELLFGILDAPSLKALGLQD